MAAEQVIVEAEDGSVRVPDDDDGRPVEALHLVLAEVVHLLHDGGALLGTGELAPVACQDARGEGVSGPRTGELAPVACQDARGGGVSGPRTGELAPVACRNMAPGGGGGSVVLRTGELAPSSLPGRPGGGGSVVDMAADIEC